MSRRSPQAPPSTPQWSAPQHPDLERCPSLIELVPLGLAHVVAWNASHDPTHYRATPAGQALIDGVLGRNAARLKADPDLRRRVECDAFVAARAGV